MNPFFFVRARIVFQFGFPALASVPFLLPNAKSCFFRPRANCFAVRIFSLSFLARVAFFSLLFSPSLLSPLWLRTRVSPFFFRARVDFFWFFSLRARVVFQFGFFALTSGASCVFQFVFLASLLAHALINSFRPWRVAVFGLLFSLSLLSLFCSRVRNAKCEMRHAKCAR